MNESLNNGADAIEGRGRFRFGLRTVLVAMTVVSIVLFLLLPAPDIVATVGLYLVQTLLVTFFGAGAMYAREKTCPQGN